jgi:parallel beta-helix repeat protein
MNKIVVFYLGLIAVLALSGCFEVNVGSNNPQSYTFFVDDDFTNTTVGWNVTHFSTISEPISYAKDNESIYVHSGVYKETFSINKRLIIRGEDALTTIIDGQHTGEDIILVEGNGWLDISGFTLINSGKNQQYDEAAIDLRSSGNHISKNIFHNNTCGIYGMYSDDNSIEQNMFDGNLEYGAYFLTSSDGNYFSDNVFMHNSYALRIKGARDSNVTRNVFMDNQRGLFLCCGSSYNLVYDNIFYNNSEWNANDLGNNYWDTGSIIIHENEEKNAYQADSQSTEGFRGNFWDIYHLASQGANDTDGDGIVDAVFNIPLVDNDDHYPLKYLPTIQNPFFSTDEIDIVVDP